MNYVLGKNTLLKKKLNKIEKKKLEEQERNDKIKKSGPVKVIFKKENK